MNSTQSKEYSFKLELLRNQKSHLRALAGYCNWSQHKLEAILQWLSYHFVQYCFCERILTVLSRKMVSKSTCYATKALISPALQQQWQITLRQPLLMSTRSMYMSLGSAYSLHERRFLIFQNAQLFRLLDRRHNHYVIIVGQTKLVTSHVGSQHILISLAELVCFDDAYCSRTLPLT